MAQRATEDTYLLRDGCPSHLVLTGAQIHPQELKGYEKGRSARGREDSPVLHGAVCVPHSPEESSDWAEGAREVHLSERGMCCETGGWC